MDVKVTYTAIVAAVLLGATTVGQFFVISHLHAEIRALQLRGYNGFTPSSDVQSRRLEHGYNGFTLYDGQTRKTLRKFASGATPPPAQLP